MPRRLRTTLFWLASVAVVLIIAALLFQGAAKPQSPSPLPNPNGYDSFVQAGALAALPDADYTTLGQEALRAVIQTNSEALRLLRVGLTQRCAVPVIVAGTNFIDLLASANASLARFKCLAQLLAAEGRLAEMENRPADATRCYLDCIRFGNEQSRGGPLINRLVGIACEAIGYQRLLNILRMLSHEELRQVIPQVDDIRQARTPLEQAMRAERVWIAQVGRHSRNPFLWLLAWPQTRRVNLLAAQKDLQSTARLTLLTVELSLRCYQAERGKPPVQLNELTPKFLKDIPPDPFNGKPLVYRPQGTNWLLYSVGPDRVDSGGVPVIRRSSTQVSVGLPFFSITVPSGDVFYDSTW